MRVVLDECLPRKLKQDLSAIIAMVAASNRLRDLRPLMGEVTQTLSHIRPGEVRQVGG